MITSYTEISPSDFLERLKSGPTEANANVNYELLEIIEEARLDLTKENPDPEPIITQGDRVVMTRGNFSAIVGQAKSRKTFLTTAIAAAYLAEDGHMGFESTRLNGPVLWVDTEMATGHVARVARRINRIANLPTDQNNPNLILLCLREYAPKKRCEVVEEAIKNYKPAICVIDGVADLINSVNNEDESTEVVTMLMRVTKKQDCHIITVVHLNPGTDKPRGHLGSEVLRKAETIILVKKSESGSEVKFERCRDIEPQDFEFFVDSTGLPQLGSEIKRDPRSDEELAKVIDKILPASSYKRYNELIDAIMEATRCKVSKAKTTLNKALELGFIVKNSMGMYHKPYKQPEQQTITDEMPF